MNGYSEHETRVLVLTGTVDPNLAKEAISAGARGYLLKVNGSEELIIAVETIMEGHTYLCSDTSNAIVRFTGDWPHALDSRPISLPQRERQVVKQFTFCVLCVRGADGN